MKKANFKTTGEELTDEEYQRFQVDAYNNSDGDLKYVDCAICKNKGDTAYLKDGKMDFNECECMKKRKTQQYIEMSDLKPYLDTYTFDTFKTTEQWQAVIKKKAIEFIKSDAECFYINGQVGCGKTHISTAITGFYLGKGIRTEYRKWRPLIRRLKSVMNDVLYETTMHNLKTVPVLYIDDFLKTQTGREFTQADAQIAFELIDSRYKQNKRTIISSEITLEELMDIEESVASRIYEMTQKSEYVLTIEKDSRKNMRER